MTHTCITFPEGAAQHLKIPARPVTLFKYRYRVVNFQLQPLCHQWLLQTEVGLLIPVHLLVDMKYLWDHHNHSIHWHSLYSHKGDNSLGGTCIYYAAHMQLSLYMNNFGHYLWDNMLYYTLCIDVSVNPLLYSSLNGIPHRQSLVYTWGTWSTPYGMKASPSAPRAYWRLKLATYAL